MIVVNTCLRYHVRYQSKNGCVLGKECLLNLQSGSEPMHIFDPMSYIIEGDTALAVVFGLLTNLC